MIYLEHCLRQARVPPPRRVQVVSTSGEPWVLPDLRAELLDLVPEADVREAAADDPALAEGDLAVVPLVEAGEFPGQDVAYRALPLLRALARGPLGRSRGHVVVYRARWREADAMPAAALRGYVRRLARERRVVGWLTAAPLLRAILEPRR
jgi:hypothetical protein